jgi:hypothetical protein
VEWADDREIVATAFQRGSRPPAARRINSAGARCADAFETELSFLEQTIKHAPGERAVTATSLKSQIDGFDVRIGSVIFGLNGC